MKETKWIVSNESKTPYFPPATSDKVVSALHSLRDDFDTRFIFEDDNGLMKIEINDSCVVGDCNDILNFIWNYMWEYYNAIDDKIKEITEAVNNMGKLPFGIELKAVVGSSYKDKYRPPDCLLIKLFKNNKELKGSDIMIIRWHEVRNVTIKKIVKKILEFKNENEMLFSSSS